MIYSTSKIYNGNCFDMLAQLKPNSIDLVLTDPPYFIDGLGDDWDSKQITKSQRKSKVVKGMPIGMKFDKNQSKRFLLFSERCFDEYYRVLKPGGFAISFSQARLYHSLAMAAEMSGFEIRDMLGWCYEGQAKAFSQDHFIKKDRTKTEAEKLEILSFINGRKTPQLKPMIEPMVLAQKPKEGTFVENYVKYGVGLIDTSVSIDEKFPGNIFKVKKPSKLEKGFNNDHPTVKPLALIETLIKIFSREGSVILDPFLGSGTTALAALRTERFIIGSELDKKYLKTIKSRLVTHNGVIYLNKSQGI